MENKLQLVKSDKFGSVQCDFYSDGSDYFMTREQIGRALGYSDPRKAIKDIHSRHKNRLDKYSVVTKLVSTGEGGSDCAPLGGVQDTTVYPRKGIMEICRWSQQPKADAFMDWTWGILDGLMSGKTEIILRDSYMIDDPIERAEVWITEKKRLIAAETEVKELKPKADYCTRILDNPGLVPITAISKDYGMSGVAMNKLLHEFGIQYKKGEQWFLYEKYQGCGYVSGHPVPIKLKDGTDDVIMQTKWTQKGRKFLYDFLKGKVILPIIEQEPFIKANGRKSA